MSDRPATSEEMIPSSWPPQLRRLWRGLRWQLVHVLPTSARQLVIIAHDLVMAALSFGLAFVLRFGTSDLEPQRLDAMFQGVPLMALVAGVTFLFFGFYREVWRYASVGSLLNIVKASTLAILIFFVLVWTIDRGENIPRSVPMIQWFILIFMLGGPRFLFRMAMQRQGRRQRNGSFGPVPVLAIGADDLTIFFLRSLEHDPEPLYRVVGIVDLASTERGRQMHGVPVTGGLVNLTATIEELDRRGKRPQRLVITKPLSSEIMRDLLEIAERFKTTISRMPSLTEFRKATEDGRVELKPIALEELLGRPEALLDQEAISTLIEGKRVLVTGAGGSIGSELVRQIARRRPASITLVDCGEFNLYSIDYEIGACYPSLARSAMLLDVRDRHKIMDLFIDVRPQLVFHAAALKHVPLVELNPCEGILTNVMGTRNVADAAAAAGVEAFVQVSTDKAVNPTNIMGASKRLAEFYVQALDLEYGKADSGGESASAARFMTVRFGNVLGSSGSVVPLFKKQLEHGGPITITHPDIQRYFMTIREAVELILQASAHGARHADERGQIFVLDMGKPVRIVDVARQMIRLAGLEPDKDIQTRIVGLRPGEKLYEELFDDAEKRLPAVVGGVLAAICRPISLGSLRESFAALEQAGLHGDEVAVRDSVTELIPGYALVEPRASVAA